MQFYEAPIDKKLLIRDAPLQVHVILGIYCYVAYQEVKEDSQAPAPVSQLKKAD